MNGEVQCFSGLHLALGLIAMVCLLLSLLLILSTAAIPLYRRRHKVFSSTWVNMWVIVIIIECECANEVRSGTFSIQYSCALQ